MQIFYVIFEMANFREIPDSVRELVLHFMLPNYEVTTGSKYMSEGLEASIRENRHRRTPTGLVPTGSSNEVLNIPTYNARDPDTGKVHSNEDVIEKADYDFMEFDTRVNVTENLKTDSKVFGFIDTALCHPGYVQVIWNKSWVGIEGGKTQEKELCSYIRIEKCVENLDAILDNDGRVSSYSFQFIYGSLFQDSKSDLLNSARKSVQDRLDAGDEFANEVDETFFTYDLTGPSVKGTFPDGNSMDNVPCLIVEEWPSTARNLDDICQPDFWPERDLMESCISKSRCYLVPVPHNKSQNSNIEWRYSFSEMETRLSLSVPLVAKKCFLLLKTLLKLKIQQFCALKSYHLKTALYWLCNETRIASWKQMSLTDGLELLVKKMVSFLKAKTLPSFFIVKNNLISHWSDQEVQDALSVMSKCNENYFEWLMDITKSSWSHILPEVPLVDILQKTIGLCSNPAELQLHLKLNVTNEILKTGNLNEAIGHLISSYYEEDMADPDQVIPVLEQYVMPLVSDYHFQIQALHIKILLSKQMEKYESGNQMSGPEILDLLVDFMSELLDDESEGKDMECSDEDNDDDAAHNALSQSMEKAMMKMMADYQSESTSSSSSIDADDTVVLCYDRKGNPSLPGEINGLSPEGQTKGDQEENYSTAEDMQKFVEMYKTLVDKMLNCASSAEVMQNFNIIAEFCSLLLVLKQYENIDVYADLLQKLMQDHTNQSSTGENESLFRSNNCYSSVNRHSAVEFIKFEVVANGDFQVTSLVLFLYVCVRKAVAQNSDIEAKILTLLMRKVCHCISSLESNSEILLLSHALKLVGLDKEADAELQSDPDSVTCLSKAFIKTFKSQHF